MLRNVITYRIRYEDENKRLFTHYVWRLPDALKLSKEIKAKGYTPERFKIEVNFLESKTVARVGF